MIIEYKDGEIKCSEQEETNQSKQKSKAENLLHPSTRKPDHWGGSKTSLV